MNQPDGSPSPDRDPLSHPNEEGADASLYNEPVQYAPVGARLPEGVAAGVLCTGAIVFDGPEECVIDFVQNLSRPPRVGARIVMTPHVMSQFVAALKENLRKHEEAFGPPKETPWPRLDRRPTVKEIYDELRLSDEQLSGAYATTVMVSHSPSEFCLDFITRFFPKAAVSARVYLSASRVPAVLRTLTSSVQKRLGGAQPQSPPAPPQQ